MNFNLRRFHCSKFSVVPLIIGCQLLIGSIVCAPANQREQKDLLLVPAVKYVFLPSSQLVNPNRNYPSVYQPPPSNLRGPFDFIGNWIQGSNWFPVEVNVPDTVSNITNGIQNASGTVTQWTQNAGSGISQWTQNAQNGISQFGQNAQNGFNQFTTNLGNNWNQFATGLGNQFPQISQATQNFGNGVNQFTQNVGSGVNQFTGNLGNWMQSVGQNIPIISQFVGQNNRVPVVQSPGQVPQNVVLLVRSDGELLDTFP